MLLRQMNPEKNEVAIGVGELDRLFAVLVELGYKVVGPTVREGAIVYDDLASSSDLPTGWTDEQDGGQYRLKRRDDEARFGYVVGPHSWKKFLHPPALRLWSATRENGSFRIERDADPPEPYAFIGVRACELQAIAIQDRIFLEGEHVDPSYKTRRENAFLVAVNCGQAGGTCFCVSMDTGPKARGGFDLALTEVLEGGRHYFVVEAGSERGQEVADALEGAKARDEELAAAQRAVDNAASQMGRSLDTEGLKELLEGNYQHPRWGQVADRCLACTNCTMVCPTCFCSSVEDVSDLTGEGAERWRTWDSCFSGEFTYIHGGNVRQSVRSRYRQWMTHKLATWHDQFGSSGCVGCGRCITWCPVAIDITEEAAAIRATDGQGAIGKEAS